MTDDIDADLDAELGALFPTQQAGTSDDDDGSEEDLDEALQRVAKDDDQDDDSDAGDDDGADDDDEGDDLVEVQAGDKIFKVPASIAADLARGSAPSTRSVPDPNAVAREREAVEKNRTAQELAQNTAGLLYVADQNIERLERQLGQMTPNQRGYREIEMRLNSTIRDRAKIERAHTEAKNDADTSQKAARDARLARVDSVAASDPLIRQSERREKLIATKLFPAVGVSKETAAVLMNNYDVDIARVLSLALDGLLLQENGKRAKGGNRSKGSGAKKKQAADVVSLSSRVSKRSPARRTNAARPSTKISIDKWMGARNAHSAKRSGRAGGL